MTINDKGEFVIDDMFKNTLRKLNPEEARLLEQNIIENGGARDPLVLAEIVGEPKPILLDGHNRFAICEWYGLPFQTVTVPFESREEAILWVIANNAGRRNLASEELIKLTAKAYIRQRVPLGRPAERKKKKTSARQMAEKLGIGKTTFYEAVTLMMEVDALAKEDRAAAKQLSESPMSVLRDFKGLPPIRKTVFCEHLKQNRNVVIAMEAAKNVLEKAQEDVLSDEMVDIRHSVDVLLAAIDKLARGAGEISGYQIHRIPQQLSEISQQVRTAIVTAVAVVEAQVEELPFPQETAA